jgi:anti-sigma B factor antagonist
MESCLGRVGFTRRDPGSAVSQRSWKVGGRMLDERGMTWSEESLDELVLIKLSGEIDLQHSPKLRQLLQDKITARTRNLVLDFSEVRYIDSSGLATLVEYYKNARPYAGRLAVAEPTLRVRSIFDLVRLGEIFGIFATVAEAREALSGAEGKA